MNRLSIHEDRVENYIEKHYGYNKKIDFSNLTKESGVERVFFDELKKTKMNGYPLSCDYLTPDGRSISQQQLSTLTREEQKNCRLRYYYMPKSHEIYIGGTGSGKTTGCVEPQLRAIAAQKNKPNLFITDPKGELYDRNAEYLSDNGYKLYVLNFKNFGRSDRWNPLLEVYDVNYSVKTLGKGVKERAGKVPKNVEIVADESEYGDKYYLYKGIAFPSITMIDSYIDNERDIIEAHVDDLVNQIANMFITVQNEKDPSWEYGAQDLLRGILVLMLEMSLDESTGFTRDMMTIKTIRDVYQALKIPILTNETTLAEHPLLQNRSEKAPRLMATALANAPNTMRSYCGVFDGQIMEWFQSHILSLTTGNTVDLEVSADTPMAIFVITRDYDKSDFKIAGLFIDWVYRQMLQKVEKGEKCRTLHFLLDEFGNVPRIKDFENKISTSRSRDIWFHLVLQSYNQLDLVYTPNVAGIIKDNCNAQIFLGSQNRKTKEIFSEECGKKHIPTLRSELTRGENEIVEVPLLPVNILDNITPGQIYVKRIYSPVISAQFIRSYVMTENGDFPYPDSNGLRKCAPFHLESFSDEKYDFTKRTPSDDLDAESLNFDFINKKNN